MDTTKHLPRDVFMYLLVFVTLIIVSVNVGTLLFQFVNLGVPDVVVDPYRPIESYKDTIRWSVAMLIIVFPVFVWAMRFLARDIVANPEKRDLKIRRWVLYLTLFAAGAVLVGDLVALVYSFLQGELTMRFVLKIAAILLVAGTAFTYFLNELREKPRRYKPFALVAVIVIAAVIITGLVVAGLPQSKRLLRLDDQRAVDLSSVHNQVLTFWKAKSRLPKDTAEIQSADVYGAWKMPTDPTTGESYEYRVISAKTFELCAVFQVDTSKQYTSAAAPREIWAPTAADYTQHGVGRFCFERTIDPDFLKTPQ